MAKQDEVGASRGCRRASRVVHFLNRDPSAHVSYPACIYPFTREEYRKEIGRCRQQCLSKELVAEIVCICSFGVCLHLSGGMQGLP